MKTVGFYVNAGKQTGYGHVVRSMALADELVKRGFYCSFRGNRKAVTRVVDAGWESAPNHDFRAGVWIVDLEGGCPPELALRLRPLCDVLVILNGVGYPDGDPGRLLSDLCFYQGVTMRPYELDWPEFCGEWFVGPEWLILRREFQTHRIEPRLIVHDPPHVVISGGGADPKAVTDRVIQALCPPSDWGSPWKLRAIWGPLNEGYYGGADNVNNPPSMAEALAWADLAVVSYGMTTFECLALGLPTIALSISPDHAASAELVQEQSSGALVHLGEVENVHPIDIRNAVTEMLPRLPDLSEKARAFVDGQGAQRVADKILQTLEVKR